MKDLLAAYIDNRHIHGPFDIIGDVHGCYDELVELLLQLGYIIEARPPDDVSYGYTVTPPPGRQAVFVGDLVDRGPKTPDVLRLAMSMVNTKVAWCVPGNHDVKLVKWLAGKQVQLKHGLQDSVEQLETETPAFKKQVKNFLEGLVPHYLFDDGNLCVVHAGIKEEMQGRSSGRIESFCLFGETTGEIDDFGLPIRLNWAEHYHGKALVVYGHTPVLEVQWINNTVDIDTGCVFGNKLTALRYPEREIISVPARKTYSKPSKPLHLSRLTSYRKD